MEINQASPTIEPAFICDKDVARLISGGRSTVWAWAKDGRLPRPIRIGRRTLWDRAEVIDHLRGFRKAA